MRVCLIVDEVMQINNVFHVSVCEPDTLFLRVDGCSWDIVVRDIPDPLMCIRRLLVYDYLDLTDNYATFLTIPRDEDESECEHELETKELTEEKILER